jgi:hypothetical protein
MSDTQSAHKSFNITPSDTVMFTQSQGSIVRAIYCGGAGNITVINPDLTTAVFNNVPAGYRIDCKAIGVMSTGTTATLLTGMV